MVYSVHFKPDDFVEGTSRRNLKKGSVNTVFEWNREHQMQPLKLSVLELIATGIRYGQLNGN